MTEFKIRIQCTSIEQLTFNNKKISKKNEMCVFDSNIKKIIILYKTLDKVTTKTLEFICDKELNKEEFEDFIKTMKDCGFKTTSPKNKIQFINMNTKPFTTLFNYTFMESTNIGLNKLPLSKKKNRSSYKTVTVYSKL